MRSISAAAGCTRPTAIHGPRSPRPGARRSTRRRRRGRAPRAAGLRAAEAAAFTPRSRRFRERAEGSRKANPTAPLAAFLEPGDRWNPLIDAVSTYYSGAELDRVSARDLDRYEDTGVNWRVVEGYGSGDRRPWRGLRCSTARSRGSTIAAG